MKKIFFLSLLALFAALSVNAQGITVRGTVIDGTYNEPFPPGFVVYVKGTHNGTVTDFDGNFKITVKSGDILVFTQIGYKTVEYRVTSADANRFLTITLVEDYWEDNGGNGNGDGNGDDDDNPIITQHVTVRGTIIDSTYNEPFPPGFMVLVKGKSIGTVTDLDGNFQITVQSGDILVFSRVGYRTVEYTVTLNDANRFLTITLVEDTSDDDDGCICSPNYVHGTVTDSISGDPLIGATIMVKGTTIGTITDLDGNFCINASVNQTLVISYIGYRTKEKKIIAAMHNGEVHIELVEDLGVL